MQSTREAPPSAVCTFSVQEYFRENRKQLFPTGEQIMAEVCLTYLLFDDLGTGHCATSRDLRARIWKYPFILYSAQYWSFHIQDCLSEESSKLALKFLHHERTLSSSIQIIHIWNYFDNADSQRFPKDQSGLHIASIFGLDALIAPLLSSPGAEPDSKDSLNRTA